MARKSTAGKAPQRQLYYLPANQQAAQVHLNLKLVDELVREYLAYVEGQPASEEQEALHAAEEVRRLANIGEIEEATKAAARFVPHLSSDEHFLFALQQQQFVELLRRNTPESKARAIEYLRSELTPRALNSHPDAYPRLKQSLLTLVFPEGSAAESGRSEWDTGKRAELAKQLSRMVREAKGVNESTLTLVLRYLALILESLRSSANFAVSVLGESAALELVEGMNVVVDGAPLSGPPLPDHCLTPETKAAISRIPNSQIIMFKSTFGLSREAVVDCLQKGGGRLDKAFKFELSALPFDRAFVDDLVDEYAVSRGMKLPLEGDDGAVSMELDSGRQPANLCSEPASSSSRTPHHKAERGVSTCHASRDSSRSPPKKLAKREVGSLNARLEARNGHDPAASKLDGTALPRLRRAIEQGHFREALAEAEQLVPNFEELHSGLAFDLHAAEFRQQLDAGDTKAALEVARTKMSAISNRHPSLQPNLKAALAHLIPGSSTTAAAETRLSPLADALESAVRQALGLQEPRLVQLLKTLLAGHQSWFRLQQCTDPFESFLDIDQLRASSQLCQAPQKSAPVEPRPEALENNDAETTLITFEDVPVQMDEEIILEAMDITNLGRAAVINLLRDAGGNIEALVDVLFE